MANIVDIISFHKDVRAIPDIQAVSREFFEVAAGVDGPWAIRAAISRGTCTRYAPEPGCPRPHRGRIIWTHH